MAKRTDVRKILEGIEGVENSHIDKLMDLIHAETDSLRDEKDEVQRLLDEAKKNGSSDSDKWKNKYEEEKKAFENFRNEITAKETRSTKEEALKKILDESKFSEVGRELAFHTTDVDGLELDEKGNIKDSTKLLKDLYSKWSKHVTDEESKGNPTPEGNSGSGGMTKEEIMKINDPAERQNKIAEHHELFGF